jgi:hypothetical protein
LDARLSGELRALTEKNGMVEQRLIELENALKSLPTQGQVNELLIGMTRIEGAVTAVGERLTALENNVKLLMRVHTK